MTDPIENMADLKEAMRAARIAMDEAAHHIRVQDSTIEALRADRAELRRALYEVSYCLNSFDVPPSAMTKATADALVRLNLGGFND